MPIVIGFEETEYIVDESVGTLEVFVNVSMPDSSQMLAGGISLVIQSVAGSARKDCVPCKWGILGGSSFVDSTVISWICMIMPLHAHALNCL